MISAAFCIRVLARIQAVSTRLYATGILFNCPTEFLIGPFSTERWADLKVHSDIGCAEWVWTCPMRSALHLILVSGDALSS